MSESEEGGWGDEGVSRTRELRVTMQLARDEKRERSKKGGNRE